MNDHDRDSPEAFHVPTLSGRAERNDGPAVPGSSAFQHTPTGDQNLVAQLRRFTPARIALGRSGDSLPTSELLEFSAAHAMARDAVHTPWNSNRIAQQLRTANMEFIQVHSAATNRATYLRRPDLGRKLDEASRTRLTGFRPSMKPEIVFIIADGLSALAPERYAVRVIQATRDLLQGWKVGPVILAEQARVALGDEVGELLRAEITVMLLGERPGLSSPDSLGIYLTYAPKIGRTDAERNCISNVSEKGLRPEQAAETLHSLLTNSRLLKLSGIQLKDQSAAEPSLPDPNRVRIQQ